VDGARVRLRTAALHEADPRECAGRPPRQRRRPEDYLAAGPPKNQRWTFIAGSRNNLFLAESQRRTYDWFEAAQPGVHSHHLFDGYGHLDLLFGTGAHEKVFPTIVSALDGG
jgi:hypothetical protein